MPDELSADAHLMEKLERIRCAGSVAMGIASTEREATDNQPHSPKIAILSAPAGYRASGGISVAADTIDVVGRIVSMGRFHQTFTGTGACAVAAAAKVPGTLPYGLAGMLGDTVTIGHPSGRLTICARVCNLNGMWQVEHLSMSRTARRLMEGWVRIPESVWPAGSDLSERR